MSSSIEEHRGFLHTLLPRVVDGKLGSLQLGKCLSQSLMSADTKCLSTSQFVRSVCPSDQGAYAVVKFQEQPKRLANDWLNQLAAASKLRTSVSCLQAVRELAGQSAHVRLQTCEPSLHLSCPCCMAVV